jgi:hypothetical protein
MIGVMPEYGMVVSADRPVSAGQRCATALKTGTPAVSAPCIMLGKH